MDPLPEPTDSYQKNVERYLTTEAQEFLRTSTVSNVCSRSFTAGDRLFRCRECSRSTACVLCMDCYRPELHEGHHIMFFPSAGGCCDCGDPDSWDESTFCEKHRLGPFVQPHVGPMVLTELEAFFAERVQFCLFTLSELEGAFLKDDHTPKNPVVVYLSRLGSSERSDTDSLEFPLDNNYRMSHYRIEGECGFLISESTILNLQIVLDTLQALVDYSTRNSVLKQAISRMLTLPFRSETCLWWIFKYSSFTFQPIIETVKALIIPCLLEPSVRATLLRYLLRVFDSLDTYAYFKMMLDFNDYSYVTLSVQVMSSSTVVSAAVQQENILLQMIRQLWKIHELIKYLSPQLDPKKCILSMAWNNNLRLLYETGIKCTRLEDFLDILQCIYDYSSSSNFFGIQREQFEHVEYENFEFAYFLETQFHILQLTALCFLLPDDPAHMHLLLPRALKFLVSHPMLPKPGFLYFSGLGERLFTFLLLWYDKLMGCSVKTLFLGCTHEDLQNLIISPMLSIKAYCLWHTGKLKRNGTSFKHIVLSPQTPSSLQVQVYYSSPAFSLDIYLIQYCLQIDPSLFQDICNSLLIDNINSGTIDHMDLVESIFIIMHILTQPPNLSTEGQRLDILHCIGTQQISSKEIIANISCFDACSEATFSSSIFNQIQQLHLLVVDANLLSAAKSSLHDQQLFELNPFYIHYRGQSFEPLKLLMKPYHPSDAYKPQIPDALLSLLISDRMVSLLTDILSGEPIQSSSCDPVYLIVLVVIYVTQKLVPDPRSYCDRFLPLNLATILDRYSGDRDLQPFVESFKRMLFQWDLLSHRQLPPSAQASSCESKALLERRRQRAFNRVFEATRNKVKQFKLPEEDHADAPFCVICTNSSLPATSLCYLYSRQISPVFDSYYFFRCCQHLVCQSCFQQNRTDPNSVSRIHLGGFADSEFEMDDCFECPLCCCPINKTYPIIGSLPAAYTYSPIDTQTAAMFLSGQQAPSSDSKSMNPLLKDVSSTIYALAIRGHSYSNFSSLRTLLDNVSRVHTLTLSNFMCLGTWNPVTSLYNVLQAIILSSPALCFAFLRLYILSSFSVTPSSYTPSSYSSSSSSSSSSSFYIRIKLPAALSKYLSKFYPLTSNSFRDSSHIKSYPKDMAKSHDLGDDDGYISTASVHAMMVASFVHTLFFSDPLHSVWNPHSFQEVFDMFDFDTLLTSLMEKDDLQDLCIDSSSKPFRPIKINQLITLPQDFYELLSQIYNEPCHQCRKHSDRLSICLICGEVICSFSCNQMKGGYTKHIQQRHYGFGVVYIVFENTVFLVRDQFSVDYLCLYYDEYGEIDPCQLKGKHFNLNADRYRQLCNTWMDHDIKYSVFCKRKGARTRYRLGHI